MSGSGTPQPETQWEFVPVATVDELAPGERLFVAADPWDIVIFRIGDQFFAIEDRCTHDDGPIGEGELEGYVIVCPRHGARFDVRTGAVLAPPAPTPVAVFPVQVRDGQVWLGLPREPAADADETAP